MPFKNRRKPPPPPHDANDAAESARNKGANDAYENREAITTESESEYGDGYKEVLQPGRASEMMQALTESERRYRRLFEAARDGIMLLDVDTGRIIDANPYMYELLAYPLGELLGKELWEIGVFKDREVSQAVFQRLHEEGYIRYEDLPLETKSGDLREVQFVSNVYRENGHTVIQCNIRDITERKRIERTLNAALVRELRITEVLQHPLTVEVVEDAFPGLLVAACYEPALEEAQVGGDFFDAFPFRSHQKTKSEDTDRLALVVGDVTGKGVLAAAFAGRIKDILRAFLRENPDPAYTLSRLNNYLCDPVSRIGYSTGYSDGLSSRMAILPLSLMVINTRTWGVTISSAGAEPPAILRANGTVDVIDAHDLLLGIRPDVSYTNRRISFDKGDTLLMTTDGITEARRHMPAGDGTNNEPNLLGYEGMIEIARRNQATSSLREMSQTMVREARAFGGGFRDDVCLLLARRR